MLKQNDLVIYSAEINSNEDLIRYILIYLCPQMSANARLSRNGGVAVSLIWIFIQEYLKA